MAKTQDAALHLRKTPKQARARETIDVILEAAARILEDGGIAAFNTNAVAERAGVGVASIYDYFPSKDAILLEFARREIEIHRRAIKNAISSNIARGDIEPERAIVRALLQASDTRNTIRRIAAQVLAQAGYEEEFSDSLRQVSALLANVWPQMAINDRADLTPERLFVLTRAISGVMTAAVRENAAINLQALENELVVLAQGLTRRR